MPRILIIEPVEWRAEIDTAGPYLTTIKEPDTFVESAWVTGLRSIEGWVDEVRCAPLVVDTAATRADEFDAMMIDCFADPGLRAAREAARVPVVGAAEASMCLALQLGDRFGVVSPSATAARGVVSLARTYGLSARLAGAVGVDIPIVDLEKDVQATVTALIAAGRECIARHGADVLILGCTGMMPLAEDVRAAFEVPVVEPMAAAFKTAEALARLRLVHAPTRLPGG